MRRQRQRDADECGRQSLDGVVGSSVSPYHLRKPAEETRRKVAQAPPRVSPRATPPKRRAQTQKPAEETGAGLSRPRAHLLVRNAAKRRASQNLSRDLLTIVSAVFLHLAWQ